MFLLMNKTVPRILWVVSFSMIVVAFLVRWGLPYFAIGHEGLLVKWEANNPYINSEYSGWKTINISEMGGIRIPESWSIKESDCYCCIYDEDGELWAVGTSFGNNTEFKTYKDFAEKVYQEGFSEATIEPFPPFLMMDGSSVVRMIAKESNDVKTYYCIQLFISAEQEFVLLLDKDLSMDARHYDIVEALVYSHAFL